MQFSSHLIKGLVVSTAVLAAGARVTPVANAAGIETRTVRTEAASVGSKSREAVNAFAKLEMFTS